MIEAPHDVARQRLQRLQVIISKIGVEARVHGGHRRDLPPPRPGYGPMPDDVGAGDVDDVGIELSEVAADPRRKRYREAIFGASRDRDRGNADNLARRREGRLVDRRRIDSNLHALAQKEVDETVQRLVGPVAHIVVIARKEGDAEVCRLH
jgi:hypothetical protein